MSFWLWKKSGTYLQSTQKVFEAIKFLICQMKDLMGGHISAKKFFFGISKNFRQSSFEPDGLVFSRRSTVYFTRIFFVIEMSFGGT